MKFIKLNEVDNFQSFDVENLKFKEIFRSEFINFSVDMYEVGKKTPLIQKHRPEGSKEILIPFQGKLRIHTNNGYHDFNPEEEGLTVVFVDPKEARQFENIGDIPVKVLAIFAPPFHMEEIAHLFKK